MTSRAIAAVTVLLAFLACGCQQRPDATEGSLPSISTPVGPVPGMATPLIGPTDPYIGNATATMEGRKLFVWYNCYGCHGGHGGGGMAPSLRDRTWIYGSTDSDIYNSIAEGRGKGMPAWGLKIPEQQIWELVAYIKSLRTPQEPDPPK
jgi:cytochrome c oxidase cbb3-type subunit 3